MHPIEIENCLNSMEILVDTREQHSDLFDKRVASFGCPWNTQKLEYGDYAYNFILPSGRALYSVNDVVCPDACIERKMSLVELSGNFTRGRERFTAEFERALKNKASVYLLVEDATWEKLITGKYNTQFNPKAFEASLEKWMAAYNVKPIFCKKETTGHLIKEILYRELRHRLESGYYG